MSEPSIVDDGDPRPAELREWRQSRALSAVPSADVFAPFVATDGDSRPQALALRRGDHGELKLSWPEYEAPYVVYRLVSDEDGPPYSPDRAHVAACGTATDAVDDRGPVGAVRHYRVWANSGATREEALAAQPILHAAGLIVAPVRGMAVRDDSGRVIGQWTVFPGVRTVHVERVPVEDFHLGGPHFRILAGDENLNGFVDLEAEGGRTYVYRTRCEVIVDGVGRLSEAVEANVTVTALLAPVTDLSVTVHATDPVTIDLMWTPPPAGQVHLYRTPHEPRAGAQTADLPSDTLHEAGLHSDMRLTHPATERRDVDGRRHAVMIGVPWPRDWSRAYFTPVTLVAELARLGETASTIRTQPIRDVALTEFSNKQVLTFGWPDGAAAVSVYLATKGHDARTGLTGRSYEITLEDYEKYGGMQFTGELPIGGCAMHLVPVAFSAGRRVLGEITTITYDGLLRMWYSVQITRDPEGGPASAALTVRSEVDVTGSPPFVLVHNPDRIPLSVNDGQPVDVAPISDRGQLLAPPSKEIRYSHIGTGGSDEVWVGDVRSRTGWIRMFANLGDPRRLRRLALLDPPVAALRLTGGQH
jgi:hypothetical protein